MIEYNNYFNFYYSTPKFNIKPSSSLFNHPMCEHCSIVVVQQSLGHPDYMGEAVVRISGFRIAGVRITERPISFQMHKSLTRIQLHNKLKGPYFEPGRLFDVPYE